MSLSEELTALIAGETAIIKCALRIEAPTPLLYCTGRDPAQVEGDWYQGREFMPGPIPVGAPADQRATVVLSDHDHELANASYTERLTSRAVKLWLLLWVNEGRWSDPLLLFDANVVAAGGNGIDQWTLQLGEVGVRDHCGLQECSRNCNNKFGLPRCGYTGTEYTTCGGSWAECVERGRTVRFHGLRFALAPNSAIRLESGSFTVPGGWRR